MSAPTSSHSAHLVSRLASFETVQGYVSSLQTDTSGLHEFLRRHTETLRSLSLSFYALGLNLVLDPLMEDWDKQPCFHVTYPDLARLAFSLHDFPEGFGAKIQRSLESFWSPTLRHLDCPMVLNLEDAQSIFSTERSLQSLSIQTKVIGPDLFDVLSAKIPLLNRLEIQLVHDELAPFRLESVRDTCPLAVFFVA